ncbi:hypothetical protein B0F90DRAFT_1742261, partial [Multifurca ochricompacta]
VKLFLFLFLFFHSRENKPIFFDCFRRLQYLVAKGAILRKGQKIKTKFCKFSQTPNGRYNQL